MPFPKITRSASTSGESVRVAPAGTVTNAPSGNGNVRVMDSATPISTSPVTARAPKSAPTLAASSPPMRTLPSPVTDTPSSSAAVDEKVALALTLTLKVPRSPPSTGTELVTSRIWSPVFSTPDRSSCRSDREPGLTSVILPSPETARPSIFTADVVRVCPTPISTALSPNLPVNSPCGVSLSTTVVRSRPVSAPTPVRLADRESSRMVTAPSPERFSPDAWLALTTRVAPAGTITLAFATLVVPVILRESLSATTILTVSAETLERSALKSPVAPEMVREPSPETLAPSAWAAESVSPTPGSRFNAPAVKSKVTLLALVSSD